MLVCLNASHSDKLKNRSFVVLTAMESTPQPGLLSVPFRRDLRGARMLVAPGHGAPQ